jgi:putative component of membrane protein insertase Oxa1/YidC/SpoIIIJ protein YidD
MKYFIRVAEYAEQEIQARQIADLIRSYHRTYSVFSGNLSRFCISESQWLIGSLGNRGVSVGSDRSDWNRLG